MPTNGITPAPLAGSKYLLDRYSNIYTKRLTGVDDTGVSLVLPAGCKDVLIHIEGDTPVCSFTGTAPGSDEIVLTKDGYEIGWPIVKKAGQAIITGLKAPSGQTMNVGIMAGE